MAAATEENNRRNNNANNASNYLSENCTTKRQSRDTPVRKEHRHIDTDSHRHTDAQKEIRTDKFTHGHIYRPRHTEKYTQT